MYPTYANHLDSLLTYIPPTEAGKSAHANALEYLVILGRELFDIIEDVTVKEGMSQADGFKAITAACAKHGTVIGCLLEKPSLTATTAAIALNQVRMHATRAIGAKSPMAAPEMWRQGVFICLMDLELANARAIADADQRGEIV